MDDRDNKKAVLRTTLERLAPIVGATFENADRPNHITDDAEAMEIVRRLRDRGYTGKVVAEALDRLP